MTNEAVTKLLFKQRQFPIFQNRMYDSEAEAKDCPKGDIDLVEDQRTGLPHTAAFRSELVVYDDRYENKHEVARRYTS